METDTTSPRPNHKISPCHGCPNRAVGCHGQCERYEAYLGEIDKTRDTRKKYSEFYAMMVTKNRRLNKLSGKRKGT